MAPRGTKRASSAAASGPGTKRRPAAEERPVLAKCDAIGKALLAADPAVVPTIAAKMLAPMLRHSLGAVKEGRHEFQASVVDMVGDLLQTISVAMQQAVEEAQGQVDGVDADRSARHAALAAAQDALPTLQAAVAAQQDVEAAAKATLHEANEKAAVATEAESRGKFSYDQAAAQVAELRAALEALAALKGASADSSKEGKHQHKQLAHVSHKYALDTTLVEAVLKVLRKEPDTRQSFDVVSLGIFEESLSKLLNDFEERLQVHEAPQAEKAAAARAATEAAEAAEGACGQSEAAVRAAKEAERAGAQAIKAALKHVGKWLHDTKMVMDGFDAKKQALEAFREGPLKLFDELKDLQPEPEPVEEVETEMPPASDVAPAPAVAEGDALAAATA